jgi:hypothetical protein
MLTLAVASLLFLGNGITGMLASDTEDQTIEKVQYNSISIYVGLSLLMVLLIFILTVYEKAIIKDKHKDLEKQKEN